MFAVRLRSASLAALKELIASLQQRGQLAPDASNAD